MELLTLKTAGYHRSHPLQGSSLGTSTAPSHASHGARGDNSHRQQQHSHDNHGLSGSATTVQSTFVATVAVGGRAHQRQESTLSASANTNTSRRAVVKLPSSSSVRVHVGALTEKDHYFFMFEFRTEMCTNERCLKDDMTKCSKAHTKSGLRRVPRVLVDHRGNYYWSYSQDTCEVGNLYECPNGDACPCAHSLQQESFFHPLVYKTELCKSRHVNGICERFNRFCSRAGSDGEFRSPLTATEVHHCSTKAAKLYGVLLKRALKAPRTYRKTYKKSYFLRNIFHVTHWDAIIPLRPKQLRLCYARP